MALTIQSDGKKDPSNRTLFRLSIEARLLRDFFRGLKDGETRAYVELSEIIGCDIRTSGRGALRTARDIVLREDGIVIDVVPNVGVKRVNDSEKIAGAVVVNGRIRNAARRSMARLQAVSDFDKLSEADKLTHNATASVMAAHDLMGKQRSIDKIVAAVNASATGQLPIAKTLELFRGPKVEEKRI